MNRDHPVAGTPDVISRSPKYQKDAELRQGQIGYLCTGQKSVRDAKIGDTVMHYMKLRLLVFS